ncbi:MAG TPA: hypothetical protein DHU16_03305 [Gammaproteobacteria bacterium]|nr:NUDIX hydrolase [Gammaproteobacteria bacterium]HCY04455.1 hypothetical protein [Gammaproteobacteria bacterium]
MLQIATTWQEHWRPDLIGTLVFVLRNEEVLLIHKKTGHGQGKISAPGGKLESGERVSECAAREVKEEVGIRITNPICRAELRFVEPQGAQWLGYAFTTREFSGDPIQTPEADPFWCRRAEIPYEHMWDDDRLWLPLILAQEQRQDSGLLIADLLFREGRVMDHVLDESCRFAPALEI